MSVTASTGGVVAGSVRYSSMIGWSRGSSPELGSH